MTVYVVAHGRESDGRVVGVYRSLDRAKSDWPAARKQGWTQTKQGLWENGKVDVGYLCISEWHLLDSI